MTLRQLTILIVLVVIPKLLAIAGYATPNTGVDWTFDSLVVYSTGTRSGSFPAYALNDTVTVANDRLTTLAGTGCGKGIHGVRSASCNRNSEHLPSESQVRVDVLNTVGQAIVILVNEVQPAGRHLLRWDAGEHSSGGRITVRTRVVIKWNQRPSPY